MVGFQLTKACPHSFRWARIYKFATKTLYFRYLQRRNKNIVFGGNWRNCLSFNCEQKEVPFSLKRSMLTESFSKTVKKTQQSVQQNSVWSDKYLFPFPKIFGQHHCHGITTSATLPYIFCIRVLTLTPVTTNAASSLTRQTKSRTRAP